MIILGLLGPHVHVHVPRPTTPTRWGFPQRPTSVGVRVLGTIQYSTPRVPSTTFLGPPSRSFRSFVIAAMPWVPEQCPECDRVFKSFRALSIHLDKYALASRVHASLLSHCLGSLSRLTATHASSNLSSRAQYRAIPFCDLEISHALICRALCLFTRADLPRSVPVLRANCRDHPADYVCNALAVLEHARQKARLQAEQRPAVLEVQQARARAPGEPRLPPQLDVRAPYVADLGDLVSFFGNRRTLNFYLRHECRTSIKDAPALIAETQKDSVGSHMPLMINASKGFSEQRTALHSLTTSLGLNFHHRTLHIPIDNDVVICRFYMREPLALARYAYRFVTRDHCRVRELVDPAGGGRVYADPYSGTYAAQQQREVHAIDARGVLLLLKLYTDETPITKAMERCVCPMSMYNLALPLEAMRSHEHAMLLSYFSHFPEGFLAGLSDGRARRLRKALHRAAKRMQFANYGDEDAAALVGEEMTSADGSVDTVFVRFAGLSMDYVKIAEWTQTLQNRMCWMCYTPTGEFHWPVLQYDVRTRASQLWLLNRAWELFPNSDTGRRDYLRPYGLHPEPNEALHLAGLDLFQGTPPPPLHLFYQGLLKKLFACTFQTIQRQVSKSEFTRLGKLLDRWLTRLSTSCPWLKTSFPRGLSHFLYGAFMDANDPWAATVKFGKIASKDVYRDICRFWRLLLTDLFPECPQMNQMYTDLFDHMELILRRASTDHSCRVSEVHREAWQTAAVSLFGKEEFEAMIKFHQPLHLCPFIKSRGAFPWWHDEDGEASLRPNAKALLKWTNMGAEIEGQLSTVAERRDGVRLINQVLKQHDVYGADDGDGAGAGDGGGSNGSGGGDDGADGSGDDSGGANGAHRGGHGGAEAPPTVLMGQRPQALMSLRDAKNAHAELSQLTFSIRLYLHLAQSPQHDECIDLSDMPSLASDQLDLRPGLRVVRWLEDEPGAWRGGSYLHAKFVPQRVGGRWQLVRSNDPAVFVAVPRPGGEVYYGQLILCFAATYRASVRTTGDPMCLVRWLTTAAVVARVEGRTLNDSETRGPYDAFYWSTQTGSFNRGHPRAGSAHYGVVDAGQVRYRAPMYTGPATSPNDPNPIFRLVTDMPRKF